MHANPFKSRKTLSGVSVRSWRPLTGLRTLSKCAARPIHSNPLKRSKTLSGVSWKPVNLGRKDLSDPYIFDFVD